MPLPITPLQEAIIREWIRVHIADDNAQNLLYLAMTLTGAELEAQVDIYAAELIQRLQDENAEAQAAIDERNAQITALGGTP